MSKGGSDKMQVESIGTVSYQKRETFKSKDGERTFYRACFTDAKGNYLQLFCRENCYKVLGDVEVATPCQLILEVYDSNNRIGVSLVDMVIGSNG